MYKKIILFVIIVAILIFNAFINLKEQKIKSYMYSEPRKEIVNSSNPHASDWVIIRKYPEMGISIINGVKVYTFSLDEDFEARNLNGYIEIRKCQ